MNYIYSILATLFVGIHLFSIKLLSVFKSKYYEILSFTIFTLIISRILIYYAMKDSENPADVHIILSFSVFVTFFLSLYFFKLDKIDVYKYALGIMLIIAGLYFVQTSM